jgi:hypothetical protein
MKPPAVFTGMYRAALAACVVFFVSACSDSGGGDDGGGIYLPIDGSGGRLYYNLSTGQRIQTPAGSNWDIALEAHDNAFFLLTNSGATAAELGAAASGGGGVWFTNSTDFDAITSAGQAVIPETGLCGVPLSLHSLRSAQRTRGIACGNPPGPFNPLRGPRAFQLLNTL